MAPRLRVVIARTPEAPDCYARSTIAPRTIPQRELRNEIGRILREVDAGAEFEVTVRGRPVARLIPVDGRPRFAPTEELLALLDRYPVDEELLRAIADQRAATEDELADPWERWGET